MKHYNVANVAAGVIARLAGSTTGGLILAPSLSHGDVKIVDKIDASKLRKAALNTSNPAPIGS